jgi:HEPN domain-containing protein
MTSAARRWLALAEEGLETAALLLEEGIFGPASFHAQQAAEKALKAVAVGNLETAALLLEEGIFGPASFHAQQAAEKALKAVAVGKGADPPRTHDCFYLADEADAPGEVAEAADAPTPFSFRARYPDAPGSEVSEHEAETTLEQAREVVEWSYEAALIEVREALERELDARGSCSSGPTPGGRPTRDPMSTSPSCPRTSRGCPSSTGRASSVP